MSINTREEPQVLPLPLPPCLAFGQVGRRAERCTVGAVPASSGGHAWLACPMGPSPSGPAPVPFHTLMTGCIRPWLGLAGWSETEKILSGEVGCSGSEWRSLDGA